MKAKKVLLVLCALVMVALCAVSCKKKQEPTVFYTSVSPRQALTASTKISLKGYAFESFLDGGLIKVSETRGDVKYYGALNDAGETVLPVSYTMLSSSGSFIVAEGGDEVSRHYVFSQKGALLLTSDNMVEATDVGGGYFSVQDNNSACLYNAKGEDVLPGAGLDETYAFSVCGNFALAVSRTKGIVFVFHVLTSNVVLSFFDNDTTKYSVAYVGGNDFIVIKNDVVTASDYDLALDRGTEGTVYYKQTVSRYTVGVSSPVTLSPGRFLVQVANRYSVGVTEEMRAGFSLKEKYNAVSYYKAEGKRATGALAYYIADNSLAEQKSMPDGVSLLFTPINGIAATLSSSGAIVFLSDSAEVVGKIDDAVYQDIVFSGDVVTASKVVESGMARRGGYDKNGNLVIPFEYSYISAFVGGKAIATKNGEGYVITTSGAETYIGEYSFPHYFDGFYPSTAEGFVGVMSLDGVSLVSPAYQGFDAVRRYGNAVYVALYIGEVVDVYRLY